MARSKGGQGLKWAVVLQKKKKIFVVMGSQAFICLCVHKQTFIFVSHYLLLLHQTS
jgi:hypothetical protein